jgi:hypothetical protein
MVLTYSCKDPDLVAELESTANLTNNGNLCAKLFVTNKTRQ